MATTKTLKVYQLCDSHPNNLAPLQKLLDEGWEVDQIGEIQGKGNPFGLFVFVIPTQGFTQVKLSKSESDNVERQALNISLDGTEDKNTSITQKTLKKKYLDKEWLLSQDGPSPAHTLLSSLIPRYKIVVIEHKSEGNKS
jgi:hypothetical protein